jgi:hypothetical protein
MTHFTKLIPGHSQLHPLWSVSTEGVSE